MGYSELSAALAAEAIELKLNEMDTLSLRGCALPKALIAPSSAHLPLRMMLPPGVAAKAMTGMEYLNFDNRLVVTWQIAELMLYSTPTRGGGIGEVWSVLTQYIDRYIAHFSALRELTATSEIISYDPAVDVFNWPKGSDYHYHGVQMVVTVKEVLCERAD